LLLKWEMMPLTSVSSVQSVGGLCLNLPVQGLAVCSGWIILIPPHTPNITGN
jgi:hypothetical protein